MVYGLWRLSTGRQYYPKVRISSSCSEYLRATNQSSIWHVMEVQRQQKKPVEKPLYGLAPYFTAAVNVAVYLYLQPIILEHHLIPFVFYVGLINAYSVGMIIIAHLTKDPEFPMQNVLILPLSLAVVDSLGPFIGLWPSAPGSGTYQIAFVFMLLGLSVGVYGSFVVCQSMWFGESC